MEAAVKRSTKFIAASAFLVAVAGGAGVAAAGSSGDAEGVDSAISGDALQSAKE